MDSKKKTTESNQGYLLSLHSKSKEEFKRHYKTLDKTSARELFLGVLTESKNAIIEGNVAVLKKNCNFIEHVVDIENHSVLRGYYSNNSNPIKSTNLVILACKYNKIKVLEFLLKTENKILSNLSVWRRHMLLHDEDNERHNAFYYAMRSSNLELLDSLINNWPGDYCAIHWKEFDRVLSKAYEELKLKNVPLTENMEYYVQNKLLDLRFFSNTAELDDQSRGDITIIKERIQSVLINIRLLKDEYSKGNEVDERFLFISKSIAVNIHMLKRQLKSTYRTLPWEEIEFSLICFHSSHTKRQEINLFYSSTFYKIKILEHLENFEHALEEELGIKEINVPSELPKLKREEVISEIVLKYPNFESLYKDFQQVRDIYSLQIVSHYLQLAINSDPKQRDGRIIIIRAMQVTGEHLKNTLESPKLSNITIDLLLLSLPRKTQKIIINLRNSLSHVSSLAKRTEIEENHDSNVFPGIHEDIKKVAGVIIDILFSKKIKIVQSILKKILKCEKLDEICELSNVLSNVELDELFFEKFELMEHAKIQKHLKAMRDKVTDMTSYEFELVKKMESKINCVDDAFNKARVNYTTGLAVLKSLCIVFKENLITLNFIKEIKFRVNQTLEKWDITPKIEQDTLRMIAQLSMKLIQSLKSRMQRDSLDNVQVILFDILYIAEFGGGDNVYIEELWAALNEKHRIIEEKKENDSQVFLEKCNRQLNIKLAELKDTLNQNVFLDSSIEPVPFFRNNKKLQAVVEMLVLDVMSIILISRNHRKNYSLFSDGIISLPYGKCLRNHLAHHNALVDVSSDFTITLLLNAKKLTESLTTFAKKSGQHETDPSKFEENYKYNFAAITNQKKMFEALEKGNFKMFKDALRKGADIFARSLNSWTSLHFAAKGLSLELVKYFACENLLSAENLVNCRDINGQTPLHVASANGRESIVEYFVTEIGININDQDNIGRTPLHIAVQNGCKDTVKILLKYKANTEIKNVVGLSAIHHAIRNNHVDIAKILLANDTNVDINETMGGFTPLHEAVENGHLELVNFLLENKAYIDARNDRDWTPLHAAALNGHLEIVKVLIEKEATINAKVINGCTPLHYAIEGGHENVTETLLKYGADANAVDKPNKNTPLHYAAKYGNVAIVRYLLKNNATITVDTKGVTPLHLSVKCGHLEIMTFLIQHGDNIHAKDKNNATPLHYAVIFGRREAVETLIKNGANVNAKTDELITPLHIAVLNECQLTVDFLIKSKAVINASSIDGSRPIHAAAEKGSKDLIDLLLKNKAEVNARNNNGITPLHLAARNGCLNAIIFLIKNGADVNAQENNGLTPLNFAISECHKDAVNLLLKSNAFINPIGSAPVTYLQQAVEMGNKEIVESLLAKRADVKIKCSQGTLLISAIKNNHKEIAEILIKNGANVNDRDGEPLLIAVLAGYKDIVDILLKSNACVGYIGHKNTTVLHLAAKVGHKSTLKALISKGANIDATSIGNVTPLHVAVEEGNIDVVQLLIENGANVNRASDEVSPLHIAAVFGYDSIVALLLKNGADSIVKDSKKRTPLELAVLHGHLEVVKVLLKCKKVDINIVGNDDWTLLHISSQGSSLEMVRYLTYQGLDVKAKNKFGSKPIHIAAREGKKDTVEFFLGQGLHVCDPGASNQTLIHYAAMKGHSLIVKYLIAQGANVNAQDINGVTPMHIAAQFSHKNVIAILLENNAVFNKCDQLFRSPLQMASDKIVIDILASTESLFEAVRGNNFSEVNHYITVGAAVNARNYNFTSPLHYAAWKGYGKVVDILLQNKADPNTLSNKGFTALHYAAKYSHLNIVKSLLSCGASFDVLSISGKSPSNFTADENITNLLKLIAVSFDNIKYGNSKVIKDLNMVDDLKTLKAIMGARNKQNQTLVVFAAKCNFLKLDELKQVGQVDPSLQIALGFAFLNQSCYEKALKVFNSLLEKREYLLGSNNPGTLDIKTCIAKALYAQGSYQESLNTLQDILDKQKANFDSHHKDILNTRSTIALVLHRQGKDEEAYTIFQEVFSDQKEMLGLNHPDTMDTQFHMGLVLDRLEKYEDALNINKLLFKKWKETLGEYSRNTVRAQNNIAMVLSNQGKYDEALEIYNNVFEKKRIIFGNTHSDTLRTLHNIAGILSSKNKHHEALQAHKEVFDIQKKVLGPIHPDTLNSQYNMACILFAQGKWIAALKAFKECFYQSKGIFGTYHSSILDMLKKIEIIYSIFKLQGSNESEILQHLKNDVSVAAYNGDIQTLRNLLKDGASCNDKDIDGKAPIHYAVSNRRIDALNILLENGADVTQVSHKGNTPLHIATSNRHLELVQLLLQNVSRVKLNSFLNYRTASSGTTALHVAALNGTLDIAKLLLKYGAIYNVKNKHGKTPLEVTMDQNIVFILNLLEKLFKDANEGNIESIYILKSLKIDDFKVITNARNNNGSTLLQVAIVNKNEKFAHLLLDMFKS